MLMLMIYICLYSGGSFAFIFQLVWVGGWIISSAVKKPKGSWGSKVEGTSKYIFIMRT